MSGKTVDDVIALVRSAGGRATPSRRAILRALFDTSPTHPTAEQLTASVQQVHPDIAPSTVYRFLDELGRLGIVRPVRIGDAPTSYHLADDAAHHHLLCTVCGSMTEVPDKAFSALRRSLRRDVGFEIDALHLTLSGTCAMCEDGSARTQHHD